MDKNAIKKYAIWARRELIERVSQRAMFYGVTSQSIGDPNAAEVNGRLLSPVEKKQRQALIRSVQEKGFSQVMEEVAYTWFNRFAALRFMEVNGYLPSLVRVFTNEAGEFKPQILSEALHLDLEGLDKQRVLELVSGNKSEELFRYLLIVQCNALNSILPGMFQKIEDYTELLLPDNLLREGSVIEQMVTAIPEEDWTDQVQIIGWLYQYYNTEPKDKVFADLKKNIKISKENIPAATQLFTPDWIVHYMVENSLGRLWLEGHPNDALKSEWKYYLDEAEQEPEVEAQLAEIRKEYAALKPEEIRVIDPCCGSGHILVVMFDVLVQIYEDYGYTAREAAVKIVENNLWGLDIDERAAQLSYFAVMMKARQYDRRFFTRKVQPHVHSIHETNVLLGSYKEAMSDFQLAKEHQVTLNYLIDAFVDAKEYGSILQLEERDYAGLRDAWKLTWSQTAENVNMTLWSASIGPELSYLIEQAIVLTQKYSVVVTNPPYMGNSGMNSKLSEYVKRTYPKSKSDLFACFIEQGLNLLETHGFLSEITMESWMFLTSFEKLRLSIISEKTIVNMVHMPYLGKGNTSLGINFGTSAVVFRNRRICQYCAQYEYTVYYETDSDGVPFVFPTINDRWKAVAQEAFLKTPGSPITYWLSERYMALLASEMTLGNAYSIGNGLSTSDNDRFLRFFWEVDRTEIGEGKKDVSKKWFLFQKGGDRRKWYGNLEYVVNWKNNGEDIKYWVTHNPKDPNTTSWSRRIFNSHLYFLDGITWGVISSGLISFRITQTNSMISNAAGGIFGFQSEKERDAILAALNSKIWIDLFSTINPTINYSSGVIQKGALPRIIESDLPSECVRLSKADWDSFETSWNFCGHPLVPRFDTSHFDSAIMVRLNDKYQQWVVLCRDRFNKLKRNEEELNRIFIDMYGLQSEFSPEEENKDVTVRQADLQRDIRSLLSYAVGCMLGRYSLDVPGLIYAGGTWDTSMYITFKPDKDAILPICDDEYFEDDIVGRFVEFVEVVYGKDTLEENLRFIADALGGKGSSREVIRNYFINDFYADHLKVYQKRPIYWLFDSGKKNGFKCLIYMHRYQPDTIARIRTDYVHEQQSRYRTAIADLEHRVDGASPSERVKLTKQLSKIRDQAEELRVYEEKIHHLADQMISIDLDDGVKVNYAKFQDVLAKIK